MPMPVSATDNVTLRSRGWRRALIVTVPSCVNFKALLRILSRICFTFWRSLDNGRSMGVEGFCERSAPFGPDGTCSVTTAWPGEHTLDATLAIGDERGARLRDFAPKTVVRPASGEIALTVDRAAYDAALQRLRK